MGLRPARCRSTSQRNVVAMKMFTAKCTPSESPLNGFFMRNRQPWPASRGRQKQMGFLQNVRRAHHEAADDERAQQEAACGDLEGSRSARLEVTHEVPGFGDQQPEHGEAREPDDEEGAPKVFERRGMRGE